MKGNLYIVATPIGNLEDITLRAIRILKEVDIIIAEDTRHTLKLLNHLEISKPLISYYKQNEQIKSIHILEEIENGKNVALVSDAGTPGISDPGEVIIKEAIEREINIIPIPGACAFVNALVPSGIETSQFYFEGFLPVSKSEKEERLKKIKEIESTIILYEAPHKLLKTLTEIERVLGNRRICLSRELTKIHEEFIRGNVSDVLEKLNNLESIKGEFVIIIEKNFESKEEAQIKKLNEMTLENHYDYYNEKGMEKKQIIKQIAKDRNVNKNEIYMKFI